MRLSQRRLVFIKEARRLVPTVLHYVAWGDAMFDSTLKGVAAGYFAKLCRWLEIMFPINILLPVPEGRTSMLEPVHHWCAPALARSRVALRRLRRPRHRRARIVPLRAPPQRMLPCAARADLPSFSLRSLMSKALGASCQKRSACSPETATARCSRTVCTGIFLLRCRS